VLLETSHDVHDVQHVAVGIQDARSGADNWQTATIDPTDAIEVIIAQQSKKTREQLNLGLAGDKQAPSDFRWLRNPFFSRRFTM
jgi:hypothetical protein